MTPSEHLPREQVEALVHRQAAAWISGDAVAAAADFAEDGVLISPMGVWRGPHGVQAAVAAFLEVARVVDVQVRRILVDGDSGGVEWTWTEHRHGDAAPVTMEDAIVFRLRGAGLVYWREYFDPHQTVPVVR